MVSRLLVRANKQEAGSGAAEVTHADQGAAAADAGPSQHDASGTSAGSLPVSVFGSGGRAAAGGARALGSAAVAAGSKKGVESNAAGESAAACPC
jgi:hypothetical protein